MTGTHFPGQRCYYLSSLSKHGSAPDSLECQQRCKSSLWVCVCLLFFGETSPALLGMLAALFPNTSPLLPITASTLSIKICRSPPGTKAALPPRDSKPCPALRPGPQPRFLLCLHGVNRNWKPACSPPKQSFLRSRGEHVFIDSSLTNVNPPASCLLRNVVKWRSVNINN